jgi:hypothetical protein
MLYLVPAAFRRDLVSDPIRRIAQVNGRVVGLDFVHFNQRKVEDGIEKATEKVLSDDMIVEDL